MSDLERLIAAVEAGTLCAGELCISEEDVALIEAVFPMDNDDEVPEMIGLAMDGSLDAALRLHEALLPGWIAKPQIGGKGAGVTVWHCALEEWESGEEVEANNMPDPARAWLLAILRALQANTETGGE